jgi:hypothetical protein
MSEDPTRRIKSDVEGKRRLAAFNRHDGQHQHFCLGYKMRSQAAHTKDEGGSV